MMEFGEQFAHQILAMRLIGQRHDRIGMGVVDMPKRQVGVQDRFDRRVRRCRIKQQPALQHHHVVVAERREFDHGLKRSQPDGRQARRFDRAHVPAAALHAQNGNLGTVHLGKRGLDGGVAAAMQHQFGIRAQKPCRVGADRQVPVDAGVDIGVDDTGEFGF